MGMTVVTGSHYIGCYIGDQVAEAIWLDEKMQGRAESVRTILCLECKHPQSAYTRLQNSL